MWGNLESLIGGHSTFKLKEGGLSRIFHTNVGYEVYSDLNSFSYIYIYMHKRRQFGGISVDHLTTSKSAFANDHRKTPPPWPCIRPSK